MNADLRASEILLKEAIEQRIAAGNADMEAALKRIMVFVPERGFAETFWPQYGPTITGNTTVAEAMDRWAEYRKEQGLDANDIPFFSQAYLYELLGKEDARTILSLLDSMARTLGYEDGLWGMRKADRLAKEMEENPS